MLALPALSKATCPFVARTRAVASCLLLLPTMRVALRVATVLLLLTTPILRVRADLVIGTVVDVNMMQTERQDFEEGWGEWTETNMELVDTSNVTDGKVSFTLLDRE